MAKEVKTVAVLTAKPGKAEELQAFLEGMLEPSRAEPGNLRYDLWRDRAEPNRFMLDELYVDVEAVAAHRSTPHFRNYLSRIDELAERNALSLDPVRIS